MIPPLSKETKSIDFFCRISSFGGSFTETSRPESSIGRGRLGKLATTAF